MAATSCRAFAPHRIGTTTISHVRAHARALAHSKTTRIKQVTTHSKLIPNRSTIPSSLALATSKEDDEKNESFQKDIKEKLTLLDDRSYDVFGPLTPIAEALDDLSGDWALSYADLSPATPRTWEGKAFLATNVGYAAAGIMLAMQGDWFFAGLTELAGAVSFWYHYSQLEFGKDRSEVRLALLTDYATAGVALITGGVYMTEMGISAVPFDALITGGLAIACLSLGWVWEVSSIVYRFTYF